MRFLKLGIALFLVPAFASAASQVVGQRKLMLKDEARVRAIDTYVWYPAAEGAAPAQLSPRGPFVPVIAAADAPVAITTERFPVVLLSHGSQGMAWKMFWIADALVKQGMIVVAVDHPGNKTLDSSGDGVMRVWDRAKDLSFALDRVAELPELGPRLDLDRVGAVGHSAGATTVLLLAGARFSADRFQLPTPECGLSKEPYYAKQCRELKALDLGAYPRELVEGNHSDPRVKAVVAYDPGFAKSFAPDSFKSVSAAPLVLVADLQATPADEIFSCEFFSLVGDAARLVPGSFHFSFMNACKPGLDLSEDIELQEICMGNEAKLLLQRDIAAQTVRHLRRSWGE